MSFDLSLTTSYVYRGRVIRVVDPGHEPGNDEADVRERHWHTGPGEVVLDIGSSHGSYLLAALSEGADRVYGWAPEGDYEVLARNVAINGWQDRASLRPSGVWRYSGWLRTNPAGPDYSELEPDQSAYAYENAYGCPVERPEVGPWFRVEQLDVMFAPGGRRTDLWKLDVEGAELEVLRGGERLLRRDRPRVLVETHDCYVPGIGAAVREFMLGLDLGYQEQTTPASHGDARAHSFFQVVR